MQVLCMKGTVAQWFSRRATDLQLHVHLSCQTKQHEMNAVKTFDMEYVLPVSSKGNHSLRVHCCILGYKLGTRHSKINVTRSILQNLQNNVFNIHMFKKKFGMLQENIGTNAKSCEICNEKNPMFFLGGKIRFRKKFVSTYLHCLNVATPLEFKFTLNGK